ncbi:MAG: exodeoxyribonuclease VII large subunit [Gemmatimonadetes bacterium]|nr:exodeoxyribonuclease VII large subunit [Gemmatimonadota bacterium]
MTASRPNSPHPAPASRSPFGQALPDVSETGILRSLPPPNQGTLPATRVEAPTADRPLTVSELTGELKSLLQGHFAQLFVEGEISGCRPAASGHVYFTLKDSKAAISCVLWAGQAARLAKPLRDGDKVEIRGGLDVFAARGTYQIVVQTVRPAGLGRLFLAFQEMKERLEREGLFDPARKRPIPGHPRVVGVVTSPTGAVIRDILKVLERRAPHVVVLLYPTRVQGEGAAREVASAIGRFNDFAARQDEGAPSDGGMPVPDVLIVGRGGGSMEDLWSFNEEVVARAIYQSVIPVISAVGHETDFTIADFVADLRAPTPSAAAEVVARDSGELIRDLEQTTSRLKGALRHRIAFLREAPHLRARLEGAFMPRVRAMRETLRSFKKSAALQRPLHRVNEERQRLDDAHQRMGRALENRHREGARRHERLAAQLTALSPRAVLSRGYSITMNAQTGSVLRRAREAAPGLALRIVLHEGELNARVGTGEVTVPASVSTSETAPAPKRRRAPRPKAPKATPVPDLFADTDDTPPRDVAGTR